MKFPMMYMKMVFYVSIFIFIFRFLEKEITIQNKPKTLRTTNWDFAPWDLYPKSDGPDYDFFLDQFLEHPDSGCGLFTLELKFYLDCFHTGTYIVYAMRKKHFDN